MIYKTENELREVISLGKPEEVIGIFLESYLQGLEYDKWKEDKDLEATEEVAIGIDNQGNDILFETRLVNMYQAVDVSEQMAEWKLDNYELLRKSSYPSQAEYIDAIIKGDKIAIQQYKEKCLVIKEKYPKAKK